MKVGDIVQNINSKEVGLIIAKNRPQPKQVPFLYVLSSGNIGQWKVWNTEVVHESR